MNKKFVGTLFLLVLFSLVAGPYIVLEKQVHSHSEDSHIEESIHTHQHVETPTNAKDVSNCSVSSIECQSKNASTHQHLILKTVSPLFVFRINYGLTPSCFSALKSFKFIYSEDHYPSRYLSSNLRPPIFS